MKAKRFVLGRYSTVACRSGGGQFLLILRHGIHVRPENPRDSAFFPALETRAETFAVEPHNVFPTKYIMKSG